MTSTLVHIHMLHHQILQSVVFLQEQVFLLQISEMYTVSSRHTQAVGEGPYVTELLDATGDRIRELGHEYGTTTGRPRRCGWLDLVTLKYAKRLNGLTALSVNHLDTIGKFDTIKVCTGYDVNGEVTEDFTTNLKVLNNAKPVYEELEGGWEMKSQAVRLSRSFLRMHRNTSVS